MDDELQSALAELQTQVIRRLAPWLVVLVIGGTTVGGTGVFRVDKFGQSDADKLKAEILEDIDHKFELLRAKEMPPSATRMRVWKLEEWVEDQDATYQVPTQEW